MLGSLLGEVKGIFGKAYLVSGLLPAAVVVLGWTFYRGGRAGLETELIALFTEPDALKGPILVRGLALVGLGLLFFAARGVVLHVLNELPVPGLNGWLRGRQLGRRRKIWGRRQQLLWELTVLRWPDDDFERRDWLPPEQETNTSDESGAAELSMAGRKALEREASARGPRQHWATSVRDIRRGLLVLYASAVHHRTECMPEIDAWTVALRADAARAVLVEVASEIHREWVSTFVQSQRYPDELWIQPTALGNRFAALDEYAIRRYGINTSTLWTRLWGILSEDERREIADGRSSVEVAANFALAFAALFVATMIDGFLGEFTIRALVFSGSTAGLGWASYRVAVYAASGLTERVTRAVDIGRRPLLASLGFEPPKTVGAERRLFEELEAFFVQAKPLRDRRALKEPDGS